VLGFHRFDGTGVDLLRMWVKSGTGCDSGMGRSRTRPLSLPQLSTEKVNKRRTNMKDSTRDKVQGTTHEVKGGVKEKVGKVVGNPDLQDEGTAEKIDGKIQKKVGDIEKVFEK
jgi:uncharacterized protein YjbJ (UPF0337 family)